MKKFLLLAGVVCLFATSAEAAQISPYVSGKLSYDFNKVKIKNAADDGIVRDHANKELFGTHFAAGVAAGHIRGELELNNSRAVRTGKTDVLGNKNHFKLHKYSVMANAYFDYLTCSPWTPYVGAGLGYSWLKATNFGADGKDFDKSTYNLAWQVMAGVAYEIDPHWTIDAGYRYADLGRIRKNDGETVTKITARDHEIMLGVRYTF